MSGPNSNSTGSAWLRMLDSKWDNLHKHDIQPSELVKDEASFRLRFEDLCRTTLKDPFSTTLLSRLQAQPIDALAKAVEASNQEHNPPLQLASLIWACIWEAVIVSNGLLLSLTHFVGLTVILTRRHAMPAFIKPASSISYVN